MADAPPRSPAPTGYAAHVARREADPATPPPPGTPVRLPHAAWAIHEGFWRGAIDGERLGTSCTLLFFATDTVGAGPRLHVHPYDEVIVVREGRARFTVGDTVIDAEPGDIVLGPANVPHRFENLGPGRLETMDVHLSDRWIQTDLS